MVRACSGGDTVTDRRRDGEREKEKRKK